MKAAADSGDVLRGKAIKAGTLTSSQIDWHARLAAAETQLLYEFHRWLRQEELFDLYAAIATVCRTAAVSDTSSIDLFLTCTPLELARLPWEAWELGASLATPCKIRIARVPLNIRQNAAAQSARRSRPRILVILGYDPQQNFAED